MKISIIVAVAENLCIWINNDLPWHLPEDLKRFKEITLGKPVVMWSKTLESLPFVLPWRRNIVLNEKPIEWLETYNSIDAMLNSDLKNEEEIFIIWWASIYAQFLEIADNLYITEVKRTIDGDVFFPEYKHLYTEVSREEYEEYDFVLYKNSSK